MLSYSIWVSLGHPTRAPCLLSGIRRVVEASCSTYFTPWWTLSLKLGCRSNSGLHFLCSVFKLSLDGFLNPSTGKAWSAPGNIRTKDMFENKAILWGGFPWHSSSTLLYNSTDFLVVVHISIIITVFIYYLGLSLKHFWCFWAVTTIFWVCTCYTACHIPIMSVRIPTGSRWHSTGVSG